MGQALCCNRYDKKEKKSLRFFLAGTSHSGKSTVIRQLKCLSKEQPKDFKFFNGCGSQRHPEDVFSHVELSEIRRRIKFNILTAVYNTLQQTKIWRYPVIVSERAARLKWIMEAEKENKSGIRNIKDSIADDLIRVLEDSSVQRALERSHEFLPEFRIVDGSFHYLNSDSIRRIFDKCNKLTSEDIVYSYIHTSTVKTYKFEVKNNRVDFHDMGGHTSEMVKFPEYIQHWMRGCDDRSKSFLLYCISLTDFNVPDMDNPEYTALDKSLKTLNIILSMRCLKSLPVIIFFNKMDRFTQVCAKLLTTSEGRQSLQEYIGEFLDERRLQLISQGVMDVSDMQETIINKLKRTLVRNWSTSEYKLYFRFCDTKDIKTSFEAMALKDFKELAKMDIVKLV